jgi:hypothetical protein
VDISKPEIFKLEDILKSSTVIKPEVEIISIPDEDAVSIRPISLLLTSA